MPDNAKTEFLNYAIINTKNDLEKDNIFQADKSLAFLNLVLQNKHINDFTTEKYNLVNELSDFDKTIHSKITEEDLLFSNSETTTQIMVFDRVFERIKREHDKKISHKEYEKENTDTVR
jgi:hypothetical protein